MSEDWEVLQGNLDGVAANLKKRLEVLESLVDQQGKEIDALLLWKSKMENQPIPKGKGISAPTTMPPKQTIPLTSQEVTVSQLHDGDMNITLNARISTVSPVRSGLKKDGSEWKNQSILIGDYTGQIPLVLWGTEIDTYDTLMVGNYITITGAYVKSYKEKPQLLLGKSGKVALTEEHIL